MGMAHHLSAALLLAVALSVGTGCTSGASIHTIRSPAAHFERYRTVAFDANLEAPNEYSLSPRSAGVRSHVQRFATSILQSRGYVLSDQQHADLVLRIEAGRRERKEPVSTGTTPLGGGPGDVPPVAGADSAPGPSAVETMYHGELDQEERDLVEGAFVIDAFDSETRELVWHGSARTEIVPGPVDYARLRRHVESVLAAFPARAPAVE
jgi:hypothetical protein